jgi:hypothetical protein
VCRLHCAPATHITINAARPSWVPAATFQASVQTRSSTYEKRQAPHDTKRNNPASSPFVVDGDFSGDRRLPNPELTQSGTSSEAVYPRTKKRRGASHRRIGAPRQTVATVLVLAIIDAFATAATQEILNLGSSCESVTPAFACSSPRARGNPCPKIMQGLKCFSQPP